MEPHGSPSSTCWFPPPPPSNEAKLSPSNRPFSEELLNSVAIILQLDLQLFLYIENVNVLKIKLR